MKHILVPCDFSKPAREAFKLAAQMASRTGGEVFVLYAIYIPVMYDPTVSGGAPMVYEPIFLNQLETEARKEFQSMKQELADRNLKSSLEIVYGDLISFIQSETKSKHIDLIIMGTTGATGSKEIFVGSNTERVVRHSKVPVFSVRSAPEINSIRNILLANTLELNQTVFMNKVKALQEFFNATLHILTVNTASHFRVDSEVEEATTEFARHYQLKNYHFHFKNYLTEEAGIIDFVAKENMDLLVMATHARKGLSHLFNQSITEDVINHITCPVWSCSIHK